MVRTAEFRVVVPLSVEEYRIAQMYMVTRMQEQQTSGAEGVEILANESFESEELGKGHYTSKIYHLQSKAPAWLAAIVPTSALLVQEEAWNAYPKCKTVLKCPYFNRFNLTIETVHVADSGQSDNVHNLPRSTLSSRKVDMIDISSNVRDYWSYVIGGDEVDLQTFQSHKTGRGLLASGWQETCDPVMTAYKLVTVDAPYWGFGYALEQLLMEGERALFVESHKRCFAWIDEWFGLTFDDVRKLELQMDESLNITMSQNGTTVQTRVSSSSSQMEGNGKGITSSTESEQQSSVQSSLLGTSTMSAQSSVQSSVLGTSTMGDREPQVDLKKKYSQGWNIKGFEEACQAERLNLWYVEEASSGRWNPFL